jgi:hypothetical protein
MVLCGPLTVKLSLSELVLLIRSTTKELVGRALVTLLSPLLTAVIEEDFGLLPPPVQFK